MYILQQMTEVLEPKVCYNSIRRPDQSWSKYDEVIAIGPLIMMKNVVKITKEYDIPTMVSLNPIMIDGTGMCGGCRVNIGGETKFACVDGPDFDGFKVNFDECMQRQGMFRERRT